MPRYITLSMRLIHLPYNAQIIIPIYPLVLVIIADKNYEWNCDMDMACVEMDGSTAVSHAKYINQVLTQ